MANRPQPVKLYYFCPVFRYERPQAGRYRQHYQFGVEALGKADPALDAEVIGLAWHLLAELGLSGLALYLNSIGDATCRPDYIAALRRYYEPYLKEVCPDCRGRYQKNPLRLLDCKEDSCQPIAQAAPQSADHLCPDCQAHFDRVRGYLASLSIPFAINHRLVRGLDYYTRSVFEIQPALRQAQGGAQATIIGGGRYDGLIEELGGRPTPGIGFGAGMERMVLNLKTQGAAVPEPPKPHVFIAHVGEEAKVAAFRLAAELRQQGIATSLAFSDRSLRAQLRQAERGGASFAAIIGEDEVRVGAVTLRNLATGEQRSVAMAEVAAAVGTRNKGMSWPPTTLSDWGSWASIVGIPLAVVLAVIGVVAPHLLLPTSALVVIGILAFVVVSIIAARRQPTATTPPPPSPPSESSSSIRSIPIPSPEPHFTGRERELAETIKALTQDRPVLIWGIPGIGKSTLAKQAVNDNAVRRHFADWCRQRGYDQAADTLERDGERMLTFYRFPREHWTHIRTTNVVESPFAALRLRTDAAKRFKRVDNATAVIWKMLLIAEKRFRRLNAPELMKRVYLGVEYQDGIEIAREEAAA